MGINRLFKKLSKKMFGGGKKVMKKKKKVKKSNPKKAKKKTARKVKIAAKKTIKKAAKKISVVKPKKITKAEVSSVKPTAKEFKTLAVAKAKEMKLSKGPHIAYLGLGSNVGDREEYIEQAIFLLSKTPGIKVIKKSSNYETEPEGGQSDQPQFLNAAVEVQTTLDPYKLLGIVQDTENALGREREVEWGPRTIDIDILLYDNQVISDDKLQVPHPLLHERVFVLQPLSEIGPKTVHPMLEKTIAELFEERKSEVGEKYDDELPGFKEIKKSTPDDYERW